MTTEAKWYAAQREDGETVYFPYRPEKAEGPFAHIHTLPRAPDPNGVEDWDFAKRKFATDQDRALAQVDREHSRDHGVEARAVAHAVKELEARLYLAGTPIPGGRLEREAKATGQEVKALADRIVERADRAADAEVARITRKAAVRSGKPLA